MSHKVGGSIGGTRHEPDCMFCGKGREFYDKRSIEGAKWRFPVCVGCANDGYELPGEPI